MIPEHETFKNAPIEEAVIDFHVRHASERIEDDLRAFVEALGPDYPTVQQQFGLSVVIRWAHELRKRGFNVERQKDLPVRYDEVLVDAGYRIDRSSPSRSSLPSTLPRC